MVIGILKNKEGVGMFKKLAFSLVFVLTIAFITPGWCPYTWAQAQAEPGGGNITVDFKDADITTVLRILSLKSGMNIVAAQDIRGTITIRLSNVPWETALDTILKTHGYAYERIGNVITVNEVDALTEQKKKQQELFEVQPVINEVFTMNYLNAADVKEVVDPMLSPKGRAAVLYMTGQKRWGIASGIGQTGGGVITTGDESMAVAGAAEEGLGSRLSKTLLVVDIPPYIERIRKTIGIIDVKPRQVIIESRIVEVNHDYLRDIGFDFQTTDLGGAITLNPVGGSGSAGGSSLSSYATPANFNPASTEIEGVPNADGLFETGLTLLYQKMGGFEFEAMLHALEEDVNANVLSAPNIRTLDNQEASILVGTKYPILSGESGTGTTTATATAELDYYQDIGIQLMVIPQINADGYINMIVHPIISTQQGFVSAGVATGTIPIQYPILQVREAETQVLMKDGETIVIGGLLADVKTKGRQGIPFLKDIPLLGLVFGRDTVDNQKIDLLIFITARIVGESGMVKPAANRYGVFKEVDKKYNREWQKKNDKIEVKERARARTRRNQTEETLTTEPDTNFTYGE